MIKFIVILLVATFGIGLATWLLGLWPFDGADIPPIGQKVLVDAQSGDLLVTALEKYIAAKHDVAPSIEGRITIVR